MKKVSVIVPTFNNTEENLDRLINSFNEQTMCEEYFEVIFVDDGSSEFQSYRNLKDKIEKHDNYYAYRISPSGWSSRPRNKGIKVANGKYVFFCDDDDTIFPQSLERMYNFAEQYDLDVVNPKVIRTKGWSWGWNEYKENIVNAEKNGINSMGPMTVPKLYKKDFLIQNNLFFSEGEKVWWEDVMFSCLVFSKKPKIGILADYPIYHWREQNRSAGFGKDLDYKWSQLNNLAKFFTDNLNHEDKITMITHWYNSRVLGAIRKNFHKKEEKTQDIEFSKAREWREKYVTTEVVKNLDTRSKILDYILEQNRQDLAFSYSKSKEDVTARSYITNLEFEKDAIIIESKAAITYNEVKKVNIKGSPEKPKLNLPKDVKEAVPKELNIYNKIDSYDNLYAPALKGRFTRTTWDIKDIIKSDFEYDKTLFKYNVTGNLKFALKLDKYIQDDEDKHQPFDVATRFSYYDYFSQRAIACKDNFSKSAIINGNTYVIYKNKSELLSIDLNSTIKDFLSVAKLDTKNKEVVANRITVPIITDHVYGNTSNDYLGSIYNERTDNFIETKVKLVTENGKACLVIDNKNMLSGNCTIDVSIGRKSHRFNLEI